MASQFDKVMREFRTINQKLDLLAQKMGIISKPEYLFGEDPYYDDESPPEERPQVTPRVSTASSGDTRTHVEVRTLDGDIEMVPWSEIDERVVQVFQIDKEYRRHNPDAVLGPCVLYRDPTGMVRISTDQAVVAEYHKQTTYQQPAPKSAEIPRDMDVDEVARPR